MTHFSYTSVSTMNATAFILRVVTYCLHWEASVSVPLSYKAVTNAFING